jgi:Uma2 family endonuclease
MSLIESNVNAKADLAKKYTLEEYLQREERSLHKHQFINGDIITMPGAKLRHNLIATNTTYLLKKLTQTLEKNYLVVNSDQKIYIESANTVLYPDALVVCEVPVFWNDREDLIVNPLLIVEVLSKSTRKYDRGNKFTFYKSCPTLKEYVVIDQFEPLLESWYRVGDTTWDNTLQTDLSLSLMLRSLGIELPLKEVYDKIDF